MLTIPTLVVQTSAGDVLADVHSGNVKEEQIWVSIDGEEVKVDVKKDSMEAQSPGVSVKYEPATRELEITTAGGTATAQLPFFNRKLKTPGRVCCGDVDDNGRIVVGDDSGALALFSAAGELLVKFEGHLLQVFLVKFFPSNKVLLSTGMDFSIKIWDAESGELAQTLRHQKGNIDDVQMVARGRNIVSLCQQDSSVCLWEVGSATVLYEFKVPGARSIALWSTPSDGLDNDNEYGVAGQRLVVATDREVIVYDLREKYKVSSLAGGADHIAVKDNILVKASANGPTVVVDLNTNKEIAQIDTFVDGLAVSDISAKQITILREGKVYGVDIARGRVDLLVTDRTRSLAAGSRWAFGDSVCGF